MRDLLGAVELAHVLDDLEATLIVEVHIDIGHLGTLRGEEPLEHQAVLERVERRDVHGVGDDGTRRRATARADADAVVLGPLHVLRHDQEVRGEALVADDLVLVLEALLDVHAADLARGPVVAVVLAQALLALATELALVRLARVEQREAREDDLVPVELDVALVRQLEGVLAGLRAPGEEGAHLLLALHVELATLHAHAVLVVNLRVHADAHHEVLRGGVLAREVVEVIRADDLEIERVGQLHQLLVELAVRHAVLEGQAMVLDLDVEVAGGEDLLEGAGPLEGLVRLPAQDGARDDAGDARCRSDDALGVSAEHLERRAGLVVEAANGRVAHHLHEVDVAGLVLGKQDHVVELGLMVAREGVIRREVGLAAEDGLHERARLHLVEVAAGLVRGDVDLPLRVCLGLLLRVGLHDLAALGVVLLVMEPLLPIRLLVVVLGALEVEVGHTIHIAVIRDGDGGHLEVDGALHHRGDARGTVEHRVVGVVMEMYERHFAPFATARRGAVAA